MSEGGRVTTNKTTMAVREHEKTLMPLMSTRKPCLAAGTLSTFLFHPSAAGNYP